MEGLVSVEWTVKALPPYLRSHEDFITAEWAGRAIETEFSI